MHKLLKRNEILFALEKDGVLHLLPNEIVTCDVFKGCRYLLVHMFNI